MERTYYTCQSCGISLRNHNQKRGTENDKSPSPMYCNDCYENGRFKNPDLSIAEMELQLIEKLMHRGFPEFVAKLYAMGIPELERWKQQEPLKVELEV